MYKREDEERAEVYLTSRWFEINRRALEHDVQLRLKSDLYNRIYTNYVIAAGRRSFKTERFLKRYFVQQALANKGHVYLLGAPTISQAKAIFWKDIKALSPQYATKKLNETERIIEYTTGTTIQVIGLKEFKRIQGTLAHMVGVTEYQDCDPEVFTESFEPMLNDTGGVWIEEGRPFGKNHFFDDYLRGENKEKGWANYHWKSADILSQEQILRAKSNLAPKDYEREYDASFATEFGAPYYSYSNLNNMNWDVNPAEPIIITCDFNATEKPMSWVLGQELNLGGHDTTYWHKAYSTQFTNTLTMSDYVIEDLQKTFADKTKSLNIQFYGDYAGNHQTSNSSLTDWEIIKKKFRDAVGSMEFNLRPCLSIRDSIGATNSRLCNTLNIRRQFVNPELCKPLVLDWEKCSWKQNGRELEDKDPLRGHSCRAVDYYNYYRFPIEGETKSKQW